MAAGVSAMPKYPCAFCRTKESTKLCDFVVGYSSTTMKDDRGRMIGGYHETCNNQICDECARKVAAYDFCPSCHELYVMVQKNHDRRKSNYMTDLAFGRIKDREEMS